MRHRRSDIAALKGLIENLLMTFSIAYIGVILVTLIIAGLVGPNWDSRYPSIRNPVAQFGNRSNAYSDPMATLIGIDKNLKVYIDRRSVTLDEVPKVVRHKLELGGGTVYIKADEACPYGFVLDVMRACKGAGAREIRILVVSERHWSA